MHSPKKCRRIALLVVCARVWSQAEPFCPWREFVFPAVPRKMLFAASRWLPAVGMGMVRPLVCIIYFTLRKIAV